MYYGQLQDMGQSLLLLLNVIEERPAMPGRSGLYCVEKKFGKEEFRPLSLDATDPQADNVLLYRFLSAEEIQCVRTHTSERKYYVLAHRFLDLGHIQDVGIRYTQLWAICDYLNSPLLKSSEFVKESLKTKNLLRLHVEKSKEKNEKTAQPSSSVPVLFLYLLKALLSPAQEAKRFFEFLKHSNIRVLNHFAELADFLHFLLRTLLVQILFTKILIPLYYGSRWSVGVARVIAIKIGYGIRHVLLMCGFKSFGFFIDTFERSVRFKNVLMQYLWYRGISRVYFDVLLPLYNWMRLRIGHYLYYRVGHWLYYKAFVGIRDFLYYRVGHYLYYRVGYYIYYVVVRGLLDFFKYRIRHMVLMFAYKSYGVAYDIWMWTLRFTKLILLYPFFKIYWFCSFQYEKRIKRYLGKK